MGLKRRGEGSAVPEKRDRQYARLTLDQPLVGDVTAKYEVRVRDLSLGGARLEHTVILRPGDACYLRVKLADRSLVLHARIVWSSLVGRAAGLGSPLVFHTGLHFEPLPAQTQGQLVTFLAAGGRSPGADPASPTAGI